MDWRFAAILFIVGVMQAGRIVTWEVPATLGAGPHSISEYFAQGGQHYSSADNQLYASAHYMLAPLSCLSPFIVEYFGTSVTLILYTSLVTLFAAIGVVAIMARSFIGMFAARMLGGFFAPSTHSLGVVVLTRFHGTGHAERYSWIIATYRSIFAVNALAVPTVAANFGLLPALCLVIGACVVSVIAAVVIRSTEHSAMEEGLIEPEEKKRSEVLSTAVFGLIPASGYFMILAFASSAGVIDTVMQILKNFWQVKLMYSNPQAAEVTAATHLFIVIFALLTGGMLARHNCTRAVLLGMSLLGSFALLVVANSDVPPAAAAVLFGLPFGAFAVTSVPTLANFAPAYSTVVYSFAFAVQAIAEVSLAMFSGRLLGDDLLPPCTVTSATPAPPARTYPAGTLQCSDAGLASVHGYTTVLNWCAAVCFGTFLMVVAASYLDNDDLMHARTPVRAPSDLDVGLATPAAGGAAGPRYGAAAEVTGAHLAC